MDKTLKKMMALGEKLMAVKTASGKKPNYDLKSAEDDLRYFESKVQKARTPELKQRAQERYDKMKDAVDFWKTGVESR